MSHKLAKIAALTLAVAVIATTGFAGAQKDIVDTAVSADDFNTLVAAVKAAGLVDTLQGEGPFTVFAPTDEAFAKLPSGTVDELLLPENKDKLVAILTYHVVPGKVLAADVVNLSSANTVEGQNVRISTADGGVRVNEANVIATDVMASNGAGSLSLFCPETGFWSSHLHGSSEKKHAEWLVRNYTQGLAEGVKILSYYKVFDTVVAGSPDDLYPDRTSGLLRVDRSKKPAYHAYQTLVRELVSARYERPFDAKDIEGYVFRMPDGREKTVLWSKAGTTRVSLPYSRIRLVTLLGQEYDIKDNQQASPGDLDRGVPGSIQIEIHENEPVYVGP